MLTRFIKPCCRHNMSKISQKASNEKLERHYENWEVYLYRSRKEFESRLLRPILSSVSLEDFKILKVLGTGSFGKVVLCKHIQSNTPYAMKIMEKVNVVRTKQVLHTIAEIRFLDAIRFPFIVAMDFFFRDNVYLFLVMPFINGGEMFYHLRSVKKFDDVLSKFYAAQVLLSLEFFHAMGVIYRDLKPENILIESTGYLKITDLGFCKKINNQRTFTLCGTPEYIAPEIILSQGYNYSIDWWSFGILIYEMCAGYPPFSAKEHMKLYEKIVVGKFTHPPHFSKGLRDITTNLLQVDRSKRYGVMKNGTKDLKSHEWFKTVDFDQILQKKTKPPFVPKLEGAGDSKYFESYGAFNLRHGTFNEYEEEFKNLSTPEYIAPEIILSQGYNYSVDWWSFGILIYEMCAGYPPFSAREHMKLYEKIVAGKFTHPPHFSLGLRELTTNLLQVDRSKRYGVMKNGAKDLKSHEWFKTVDFDQILQKKTKPPFVPKLDGVGDSKYFESYGEFNFRQGTFNEYEEEFKNLSIKKCD